MILPAAWLAVVFAGIVGKHQEAKVIGHEVAAAIGERAKIEPMEFPERQLRALTHHASGSKAFVAKLHVDGLIAGELVEQGGGVTLRLVVYGADGGLRSLTEIPLRNRNLGLDDLGVIRANFSDEVIALEPAAPVTKRKPAPAPPAPPTVVARRSLPPTPPPEAVDDAAIEIEPAAPTAPAAADDEAPPGSEIADTHETIAGSDASVTATADEDDEPDPVLGLRVAAGFGVASRIFLPGPATVPGYSSSPVGTAGITAEIRPTRKLALDALAERSMGMSTAMGNDTAPTTMSRWEVTGDYAVHHGKLVVATRVGLGRRSFSIDSSDPGRTPNSEYNYAIIGATVSAALGSRMSVHGLAAFEPVLWGTEPTEMAFGEASRWAFDLGASLEIRPSDHVFARIGADLQQFAWTWSQAGARGTGGAIDRYPSGTVSVGADY